MNLVVLVAMVVVGVSTIVLLVHFTGGSKRASLADASAARERFAADYPDEHVRDAVLTNDGDAAFLAIDGHLLGLVQAIGGHFMTRLLDATSIVRSHRDGTTIEFVANDFTWAGGRYKFADSEDADRAWAMIEALKTNAAMEREA